MIARKLPAQIKIVVDSDTEIVITPGRTTRIKIFEPEAFGTGPYRAMAYLDNDERIQVAAALLGVSAETLKVLLP